MLASQLIDTRFHHVSDADISGRITDILIDDTLDDVLFLFAEVTTTEGTAPLFISPSVMNWHAGELQISAEADNVAERVRNVISKNDVQIDYTDLPSTLIGPFGNTISPAMIAAIFNRNRGFDTPRPPDEARDGLLFSELKGVGISAHVGVFGHVTDMVLLDSLKQISGLCLTTSDEEITTFLPEQVNVDRSADGQLLLSAHQSTV